MKTLLIGVLAALLLASCEKHPVGDVSEERFDESEFERTKRLAEQGDVKAQDNLGVMYDNGEGVLVDHVQAVVAYKEEQVLAKLRAEEERKAKPFGGLEALARIKEAKESGATKLFLSGNLISDPSPPKGLTKLEWLQLGDNEITDLSPLAELTKLEELSLSDNQISDISPLKGLTNLEKLSLGDNQITDLSPLKGLTKLEKLCLDDNQITDVSPLAGLTNLNVLELDENQIPEDQKAMLKKASWSLDLQGRRIRQRLNPTPTAPQP